MARKTPIERMAEGISKILDEYDASIQSDLDTITQKMGQKGAAALRQTSKQSFKQHTGKYAAGWKYEYRKNHRNSEAVIYNQQAGMPHLLENGHVIRNGTRRVVGQYAGHEHIKPIADQLKTTYYEEVVSKL